MPGSTPSVTGDNFQIYTDASTNTTVIVIGNLSNGNTVTVDINSRNPVNVRCGVLEAFGNLLVAGDLTEIDTSGNTTPSADNSQDLGSSTKRWANIYSADLQLSNEGSVNDVDGTWGNYTIQEGENALFLLNRRSGKKYKFMLQEVS